MMCVHHRRISRIGEDVVMHGDTNFTHTARVYQAQGMVAVQAGCSIEAALAMMQDTADATEVTLEELADEIVERNVRFDRPT